MACGMPGEKDPAHVGMSDWPFSPHSAPSDPTFASTSATRAKADLFLMHLQLAIANRPCNRGPPASRAPCRAIPSGPKRLLRVPRPNKLLISIHTRNEHDVWINHSNDICGYRSKCRALTMVVPLFTFDVCADMYVRSMCVSLFARICQLCGFRVCMCGELAQAS
jgi:hypothetical protein